VLNPQAKLLWHGARMEDWLRGKRTWPVLVEIAPTGYCNANCPWCFFKGKLSDENINTDSLIHALSGLSTLGLKAINWTGGGEPTLHPNFPRFVSAANTLGLKQGLFTNGYNEIPFQNKFEWIRISLTPKGFKTIKRPQVPFGICLNQTSKYTDTGLSLFCEQARDFGAAYFQIRPALESNYKKQPAMSIPIFLKKYETPDFKVYLTEYKYAEAVKPRDYDECYGYHFSLSIDWYGKVVPCLYLAGNAEYVFGDINSEVITEIWNKLPAKVDVTEICQCACKNHEINRVLSAAKKVKQVEFL
jgi:MoaA/NifB/PqqE/SkfB family radical SAM enzyme